MRRCWIPIAQFEGKQKRAQHIHAREGIQGFLLQYAKYLKEKERHLCIEDHVRVPRWIPQNSLMSGRCLNAAHSMNRHGLIGHEAVSPSSVISGRAEADSDSDSGAIGARPTDVIIARFEQLHLIVFLALLGGHLQTALHEHHEHFSTER